jgi:hypothetical protein
MDNAALGSSFHSRRGFRRRQGQGQPVDIDYQDRGKIAGIQVDNEVG